MALAMKMLLDKQERIPDTYFTQTHHGSDPRHRKWIGNLMQEQIIKNELNAIESYPQTWYFDHVEFRRRRNFNDGKHRRPRKRPDVFSCNCGGRVAIILEVDRFVNISATDEEVTLEKCSCVHPLSTDFRGSQREGSQEPVLIAST